MSNQAATATTDETAEMIDYKTMANAIRVLAMDAVEKAQSGHPGMPMGMADVATILMSKYMKFDPRHPEWPDRDRFILSAGHGSMLLYSMLYLLGYEEMTLEEIRNFRQLHSKTPGHPEVMPSCGIETTTGPLGQGISNAVGFALAERIMNAHFNDDLVDHYTYVIASDGDLMEGISHESCALAGHLELGKLIVFYDDNGISIDGPTSLSYSDDVRKRFEAYGWHVQEINGHDHSQIDQAIINAQDANTPSIICCKTHIGFGAPTKQDSASSHGAPLGEDEIKGARENLGWKGGSFEIPDEILELWRTVGERNHAEYEEWQNRFEQNRVKNDFLNVLDGDVLPLIQPLVKEIKEEFVAEKPKLATRKASGKVLEKLVPALPFLIGGSADLTGSNNTQVKGPKAISKDDFAGQYIYYGVREHGMAAAMNGMALHKGVIPYSGTFLTFSDYCRPSIRLAALMKQRVIHVMTHDSIGLGEDGPTHQPVEHLAALRAIPNLQVLRPCDGVETAECWEIALKKLDGPSVIVLTRQGLMQQRLHNNDDNMCARGAYIIKEASAEPQAVLMATGSEVEIAAQAQEQLEKDGIPARLVSIPSFELFEQQDNAYRESVIGPEGIVRIGVEAAVSQGWDRWLGANGAFIGMSSFGESAPYEELYKYFEITADNVAETAKFKLGK